MAVWVRGRLLPLLALMLVCLAPATVRAEDRTNRIDGYNQVKVAQYPNEGKTLRGSFVLGPEAVERKGVSFAVNQKIKDETGKNEIPWSSVTVSGPANIAANTIATYTIEIAAGQAPGTYAFDMLAQSDGQPAETVSVTVSLYPPPVIEFANPTQEANAENGQVSLPFTLSPLTAGIHGVKFELVQEVPSDEDANRKIRPYDVSVTRSDGRPPEKDFPGNAAPIPMVMNVHVPGPGTYRLTLGMKGEGWTAPATGEVLLRVPGVLFEGTETGYSVMRVRRPLLKLLWPTASWASQKLGNGRLDPCGGATFGMKPLSPGITKSVPFSWGPLVDGTHNLTLYPNNLLLYQLNNADCKLMKGSISLDGQVHDYVVDVQPAPGRPIYPGTYAGQLRFGSGLTPEVLQVTLHVRSGIGWLIFFTLLGLFCHRMVSMYRTRVNQLPYWERLNHARSQLNKQNPSPLLLNMLADWIKDDLQNLRALSRVENTLSLLECLLGQGYGWTFALDSAPATNMDGFWKQVRKAVGALPPGADANMAEQVDGLQTAINGLLKKDQWKDLQIKIPTNSSGKTGNRKLHSVVETVNGWFFPTVMSWGLKATKTGIFVGAVLATLMTATLYYMKTPDFGAAPLTDYGVVFGIGFAGKAFNDFIQQFIPAPAKPPEPEPPSPPQPETPQPAQPPSQPQPEAPKGPEENGGSHEKPVE